VKSIIKRRFWWEITNNIDDKDIIFYWTQSKLDRIISNQKYSQKSRSLYTIGTKRIIKGNDETILLNKKILSLEKQTLV
jgi:hypothetical protein